MHIVFYHVTLRSYFYDWIAKGSEVEHWRLESVFVQVFVVSSPYSLLPRV